MKAEKDVLLPFIGVSVLILFAIVIFSIPKEERTQSVIKKPQREKYQIVYFDKIITNQKVYIVVIDSCEYVYTWFKDMG